MRGFQFISIRTSRNHMDSHLDTITDTVQNIDGVHRCFFGRNYEDGTIEIFVPNDDFIRVATELGKYGWFKG